MPTLHAQRDGQITVRRSWTLCQLPRNQALTCYFVDRSSRLGVSWVFVAWSGCGPRVKQAVPTPFCRGLGYGCWRAGLASTMSRVRSWSSASSVLILRALSNRGCQSASSASVSRRVVVLPPILRVHSA